MNSTDVTNEVRRRAGRDPINPLVIQGEADPPPDFGQQPNLSEDRDPFDFDDEPPAYDVVPPEEPVKSPLVNLGLASRNPAPPPPDPDLFVFDTNAVYKGRQVTISPETMKQIGNLILKAALDDIQKQLRESGVRRVRKPKAAPVEGEAPAAPRKRGRPRKVVPVEGA